MNFVLGYEWHQARSRFINWLGLEVFGPNGSRQCYSIWSIAYKTIPGLAQEQRFSL